jgi:hypothetical protein
MNGWTNNQTWNANLWFGDVFESLVEEDRATYAAMSRRTFIDWMKDVSWDLAGMDELPIGWARDAASQQFDAVDWDELADHYHPEDDTFYEGDDDYAMEWEF